MIVSFAYGLLKPLDEISLYRLEGGVRLPKAEKSVFNYWKDKLTEELIDAVKSAGGILCNLASGEMRNMFDWKRVVKEVKVISPEFKMWKDGKLKTIVIYTKIARGISTREIIKRRIEDVEGLEKLFNEVMEIG